MTAFIDVESVLCDALEDLGNTGTTAPDDLQDQLPFIRVMRRGGPDDHVSDYARIDIDVFAATRAAGFLLSDQIRARLRFAYDIPGVDYVSTESAAQEIPWDDPDVRRFVSTFTVTTRRA